MANDLFRVSPVKRYDSARYPVAPDQGSSGHAPDPNVRRLRLLALLFLAFVSASILAACASSPGQAEEAPTQVAVAPVETPEAPVQQEAPRPLPEPEPECATGAVRCHDDSTVEHCRAGRWVAKGCEGYCRDRFGTYSEGCDADAAEPCRCAREEDYPMVDGGVGVLTPSIVGRTRG